MSYYFKTDIHDPFFEKILFKECCFDYREVPLFRHMKIWDTTIGCKLMEDEQIPIFILPPRNDLLFQASSAHADVACLRNVLLYHNKPASRGSSKTGICTKYATLGAHCSRNKPGIHCTKIHECCIDSYNHIKKMLRRGEFFGKMFLPFGLMSTVRAMKKYINNKTSIQSDKDCFSSVWASVATSFNYVSPSHQDKDAYLSCLMVSFVPSNHQMDKNFYYEKNLKPALYFCLPEYNIAVALRPGDVIFFNPQHHHCVSQRTQDYLHEEVYVTSFYMKTAEVSGNDNTVKIDNLKIVDTVNLKSVNADM